MKKREIASLMTFLWIIFFVSCQSEDQDLPNLTEDDLAKQEMVSNFSLDDDFLQIFNYLIDDSDGQDFDLQKKYELYLQILELNNMPYNFRDFNLSEPKIEENSFWIRK
ncbi:hypothetical protein [Pararhodonellum marinum]|uniref:hypothetical protein n=1 Tax=Pararhodonellum marinum TaxID=2755358 RepID=UPI00188E6199|nr:hypothetical protein [Pararhodonellum marinum]